MIQKKLIIYRRSKQMSEDLLQNERFLEKATNEKVAYEQNKLEHFNAALEVLENRLVELLKLTELNMQVANMGYSNDFFIKFMAFVNAMDYNNYCATMFVSWCLYKKKKVEPKDCVLEIYEYFNICKTPERFFSMLSYYDFKVIPIINTIDEDYAKLNDDIILYLYDNHIDIKEVDETLEPEIQNLRKIYTVH